MLPKTPRSSSDQASRSSVSTEQKFSFTARPARLEQELSYPGELLDISHQTISLRTQLRLSYETYAWLRYLTWSGLALLGLLLIILPGFPPRALVQLLQTLPLIGRLLSLHGVSALFSLAMLTAQALTWLLLWGLWAALCHSLASYTWRLQRSRSFLASAWQSSLAHASSPRNPFDKTSPASDAAEAARARGTAPFTGQEQLVRVVQNPAPGVARASTGQEQSMHVAPALALAPLTRGATATGAARGPSSASLAPDASRARNGGALSELDASTQPRQFVPTTVPLIRPRAPSSSGEFSTSFTGWPSGFANSASGVAWDVGITRRGRPNEDSVLTLRGTCNFAEELHPFELHIVADGMGGHANGRLASHLAIRSILETVIPGLVACSSLESEGIIDILIEGVHWANQVIHQYGQEQRTDLGTTITAVLLLGETAYIINVGDSRTYVYRPGAGLTQITRDHSLVARLVETGAITPEEIYTHPDRNKIYRGLGDKTDVTVDWFILPVQSGDLLLLCSDGLWEMVRDRQIEEILRTYANSPALASNALLRAALQAGGNDNVSLLVVKVQP